MLIPGIKIGLSDWQPKIDAAKPEVVEIWYRIDWADTYAHMIGELSERGIKFGFHFWGVTSSGHEANLAYPGKVQQESFTLMKECISNAAKTGADYVNIHCGNRSLIEITLDTGRFKPDLNSPLIPMAEAVKNRNQQVNQLGILSNSVGVRLLVESVPAKVADGAWNDAAARLHPLDEYPVTLDGLDELCQEDTIGFTNDFCHTFAMNPEPDLDDFWQTTHTLAPYTQVAHINTLTAPYNGTDAHGGILESDFTDPTTFPSKTQLIDLLRLLSSNQRDVWLIGEPKDAHVENFRALQRLLDQMRETDDPYQFQ